MANLCLACCHKINGVSQLHTDILEKTIFRDYYNLDHSRFLNITNGIAYRRADGKIHRISRTGKQRGKRKRRDYCGA